MIIRVAVLEEHEALEALLRRASLSNADDRANLLAHPEVMALPRERIASGQVFVAERENEIVGFASVEPRDNGEAELEDLFVEPDKWRAGIGRALVEHCAAYARSRGHGALYVIANAQAEIFYGACGFEGAETCATRFGPARRMRKSLIGVA